MFGHQDKPNDDTQIPDAAIDGAMSEGDSPQDTPSITSDAADQGQSSDQNWQHPGQPIDAPTTDDEASPQTGNVLSPAGGFPRSTSEQALNAGSFTPPTPTIAIDSDAPADTVSNDDLDASNLINIKQMALDELLPLIDKLDQPPEERFRTIMMMIQASDNQGLIDKAYESAHQIEDEKTRAQALLDIVNEINYFTAPHEA